MTERNVVGVVLRMDSLSPELSSYASRLCDHYVRLQVAEQTAIAEAILRRAILNGDDEARVPEYGAAGVFHLYDTSTRGVVDATGFP